MYTASDHLQQPDSPFFDLMNAMNALGWHGRSAVGHLRHLLHAYRALVGDQRHLARNESLIVSCEPLGV